MSEIVTDRPVAPGFAAVHVQQQFRQEGEYWTWHATDENGTYIDSSGSAYDKDGNRYLLAPRSLRELKKLFKPKRSRSKDWDGLVVGTGKYEGLPLIGIGEDA